MRAYIEGYDSYGREDGARDNPYSFYSVDWWGWVSGYMNAKRDSIELYKTRGI